MAVVGRDLTSVENPDAPLTLYEIVQGAHQAFEQPHLKTKYYESLLSFWEASDTAQPQLKTLLDSFEHWDTLKTLTEHFQACYRTLNEKYKKMAADNKDTSASFVDFYRAHLILVQIHEAQFVEAFIKKPTDSLYEIAESDPIEAKENAELIAAREVKKYKDNFAEIHFSTLKREFLDKKPSSQEIDGFINKLKTLRLNSDLKTDSLPEIQRKNAELKAMAKRMHNQTAAYPDVFQHEKKAAVLYLKELIEFINSQLATYVQPPKGWRDPNKVYRETTHKLLESFPLPVAGAEWLAELLDQSRHDKAKKEYYALMDDKNRFANELRQLQTNICYSYYQALPPTVIEDLRQNALLEIQKELEAILPPPSAANLSATESKPAPPPALATSPRVSRKPRPPQITIPTSSFDFPRQPSPSPTARSVSSPARPVQFRDVIHSTLDILSPESALTLRMRAWQQSFLKYQPKWYRNLSDRAKTIFWLSLGVVTVGASLTGIGFAVQLSLIWGLGLGFAVCGSSSLILTSKYGKQTQPGRVSLANVIGSYSESMSPLSELRGEAHASSIYPSSTLTPSPTSPANQSSPTRTHRMFDPPIYVSRSTPTASKDSVSSPRSSP